MQVEKAICSEPLSKEDGDASLAREEPVAGVETEAQFTAGDNPKLVVPTGKSIRQDVGTRLLAGVEPYGLVLRGLCLWR